MQVHRCFFHDFSARHDAPLLTTVMCAFDATFMTSIDPAASGLRAERTSLLSLGADEQGRTCAPPELPGVSPRTGGAMCGQVVVDDMPC